MKWSDIIWDWETIFWIIVFVLVITVVFLLIFGGLNVFIDIYREGRRLWEDKYKPRRRYR